jgi:hypothetical protein
LEPDLILQPGETYSTVLTFEPKLPLNRKLEKKLYFNFSCHLSTSFNYTLDTKTLKKVNTQYNLPSLSLSCADFALTYNAPEHIHAQEEFYLTISIENCSGQDKKLLLVISDQPKLLHPVAIDQDLCIEKSQTSLEEAEGF